MRRRKLPKIGVDGLKRTHEVREWDASSAETKEQILKGIAVTWSFPSHFGHNWDALIDCLSDLSWLSLDGWNKFAFVIHNAPRNEDWHTLLECLQDVADRWGPDGEFLVFFM
ncbi:MAG: barstar family protein [Armatimonadota bacterium]